MGYEPISTELENQDEELLEPFSGEKILDRREYFEDLLYHTLSYKANNESLEKAAEELSSDYDRDADQIREDISRARRTADRGEFPDAETFAARVGARLNRGDVLDPLPGNRATWDEETYRRNVYRMLTGRMPKEEEE